MNYLAVSFQRTGSQLRTGVHYHNQHLGQPRPQSLKALGTRLHLVEYLTVVRVF